MVKKGNYRKRGETKASCIRRNQGKPFLSRGCTLPTVKIRKKIQNKSIKTKKRRKKK